MNDEELRQEVDRLAAIEDPEQQGYEAAAMIVKSSGCTVQMFMDDLLDHPADNNTDNQLRDKGALRWCQEQLGLAGVIGGHNARLH